MNNIFRLVVFNHMNRNMLEASSKVHFHVDVIEKVFCYSSIIPGKAKKYKSLNDVRQKNKSFSTSILDMS